MYIPNGIVPLSYNGYSIKNGYDNININTDSMNGKGTFYYNARALF